MEKTLIHRHMVVRAFISNPPMSAEIGEQWLRDLVDIVGMKILLDARGIYCEDLGNEGLTGVVGLTTSHASFHAWSSVPNPFMMFDLYSCQDFNTIDVIRHLNKFSITSGDYIVLDRDDFAKIVERGTLLGGTQCVTTMGASSELRF